MNNTVKVYYTPEEEKLESLRRTIEAEREAERRQFARQSVRESRIAGVLLLVLGTVFAIIGGELVLAAIASFFFATVALLGKAE